MITKQTHISARHLPLITIFFEANELLELGVKLETIDVPFDSDLTITPSYGESARSIKFSQSKSYIGYTYDETNDEQVSKIMLLGLRHAGFNNMLDDFLLRCGHYNIDQ